MLPVSGALQLKTSGAMGLRPMTSHKGAYSRLVRPAPRSESGRKRFHSPLAFASSLSSSMIGGTDHRLPDGLQLLMVLRLVRVDELVHERLDPLPIPPCFLGKLEDHNLSSHKSQRADSGIASWTSQSTQVPLPYRIARGNRAERSSENLSLPAKKVVVGDVQIIQEVTRVLVVAADQVGLNLKPSASRHGRDEPTVDLQGDAGDVRGGGGEQESRGPP